jgi:hypothetical protein
VVRRPAAVKMVRSREAYPSLAQQGEDMDEGEFVRF